MPVSASCDNCGTRYKSIPDKYLGTRQKCPKCKSQFLVEPAGGGSQSKFTTVCPHCQTRYKNISPSSQGRPTKCKNCRNRFIIEPASEQKPEPRPAPEPEAEPAANEDIEATVWAGPDQVSASTGAIPDSSDVVEWSVGDVIADLYQVMSILGEGGMGKVFKVHHRGWDLDLAVKAPKTEVINAAGGVEIFQQEAETWVNLGLHPHIVSCYYVRSIQGLPRVFAEFVEGGSLSDWIKSDDDMTPKLYLGTKDQILARILDMAIQFAWGLDYSHEQGLVHQDVKPANVMITPEGLVKVTDFGLAFAAGKAKELSGESGRPEEGSGAGTPQYFAPEQAVSHMPTLKTDMWAWAISVLEMFMGERTWQFGTVVPEVLQEYLASGPDNESLPMMPDTLASILKTCFRSEPDDRPRNMHYVARAVVGIYEQITKNSYPRELPRAGRSTADSLNNLAISLMDLDREEEAKGLWEQAQKTEPHHLESTYSQGLTLWRSADLTDEILLRQIEEARRSHPENWISNYLLGLVHLERLDNRLALKALEAVPAEELKNNKAVASSIKTAKEGLSKSRRVLRTFNGHSANVNSVSLSRDRKLIVSGSEDRTIKLWEAASGKCVRTFDESESTVNSVALSRDKTLVLSGGGDYTRSEFKVDLWDVATGKRLISLDGHVARVNSVALFHDNKMAVSGSDDKTLTLWDLQKKKAIKTLKGHRGPVTSVCVSSDGQYALSGSADKTFRMWKIERGGNPKVFESHTGSVTSLVMSNDGQYILSASADRTIKLWGAASGRLLRTMEGHSDEVSSVSMTEDARFAVSGGMDNTIRLWDLDSGRCLFTFTGHNSWVLSVEMDRLGEYALSGSVDGSLKLWGARCGNTPEPSPIMLSKILTSETMLSSQKKYEANLDEAEKTLAEGDLARTVDLITEAREQKGFSRGARAVEAWNLLYMKLPRRGFKGGWEITTLHGHRSWVRGVYLSRNSEYALSAGVDGDLKIWDVVTGQCLQTLVGHIGGVAAVKLSRDGDHGLSGGADKTVKLWDIQTGACLRTLEGHEGTVNSVGMSQDSHLVISASDDKTVKVWDLATSRCLRTLTGHKCAVNSIYLSLDDRYLVSGSGDHTREETVVKIWEVATGLCLRTFTGHKGVVNSVVFSHDYRHVVSGSSDMTIKLWDVVTESLIRTFEGHTQSVNAIQLSRDGRFIMSASSDHSIKVWNLATGECLRTFEGHRGAVNALNLSPDGRYALTGSEDNTLKVWALDWDLETRNMADNDEGAMPYLEAFLTVHMPYGGKPIRSKEPTEEEITARLSRKGAPDLSESDLDILLSNLGSAGFGWLKPESIKETVTEMAASWTKPPIVIPEKKKVVVREKPAPVQVVKLTFGEKIKVWFKNLFSK